MSYGMNNDSVLFTLDALGVTNRPQMALFLSAIGVTPVLVAYVKLDSNRDSMYVSSPLLFRLLISDIYVICLQLCSGELS